MTQVWSYFFVIWYKHFFYLKIFVFMFSSSTVMPYLSRSNQLQECIPVTALQIQKEKKLEYFHQILNTESLSKTS